MAVPGEDYVDAGAGTPLLAVRSHAGGAEQGALQSVRAMRTKSVRSVFSRSELWFAMRFRSGSMCVQSSNAALLLARKPCSQRRAASAQAASRDSNWCCSTEALRDQMPLCPRAGGRAGAGGRDGQHFQRLPRGRGPAPGPRSSHVSLRREDCPAHRERLQ